MRQNQRHFEEMERFQIFDRAHTVLFPVKCHLILHLCKMHAERSIVFLCQIPAGLEHFPRIGIRCMGCHNRRNPPGTMPLFKHAFTVQKRVSGRGTVRGFLIDDRFSQKGTHPHLFNHFRNTVFKIIHIADCGNAGKLHLRYSISRTFLYKIPVYAFLLQREEKPSQAIFGIISQRAKRNHPGVHMTVDHTGHQDSPLPVIPALRLFLMKVLHRAKFRNPVILEQEEPFRIRRKLLIHCDKMHIFIPCLHFVPLNALLLSILLI